MAMDDFETAEFGDVRPPRPVVAVSNIRASMPVELPNSDGDPNWWSLRTAAEKTGVPIATIRGWYRRGRVTSRKVVGAHGPQVELLAGDVDALASRRAPTDRQSTSSITTKAPTRRPVTKKPAAKRGGGRQARSASDSTPPVVPEGSMLIPVDSWQKMLNQLGNLHQAGQQLAAAGERAAKAETEAMFLRERIADMRDQIAGLKGAEPEPPRPSEAISEPVPPPSAPTPSAESPPAKSTAPHDHAEKEASSPGWRVIARIGKVLRRAKKRS